MPDSRFWVCFGAEICAKLTLNDPHDAYPDRNLPSRRCRSFDTAFMPLIRSVALSICPSFEPLPLQDMSIATNSTALQFIQPTSIAVPLSKCTKQELIGTSGVMIHMAAIAPC